MALNRASVRCVRHRLNPSWTRRVVDIIDLFYNYSQLFTTIRNYGTLISGFDSTVSIDNT